MSRVDQPPPWGTPQQNSNGDSMGSSILVTGLISLALVVAVVVFLHLYIRFILRRRLPRTGNRITAVDFLRFHAPDSIRIEDPAPHSTSLDPSAIAALPSFPYRKPSGDSEEGSGATECAVCLSAAEEGEVLRLLPNCKHVFHVECIDMWLASHITCPVCRAMVEPPAPLTMGTTSHEGTTSSAPKEEGSSMSSRLSASLRRILSARERPSSSSSSRRAHGESSSSRRAHGESTEDLERQ